MERWESPRRKPSRSDNELLCCDLLLQLLGTFRFAATEVRLLERVITNTRVLIQDQPKAHFNYDLSKLLNLVLEISNQKEELWFIFSYFLFIENINVRIMSLVKNIVDILVLHGGFGAKFEWEQELTDSCAFDERKDEATLKIFLKNQKFGRDISVWHPLTSGELLDPSWKIFSWAVYGANDLQRV